MKATALQLKLHVCSNNQQSHHSNSQNSRSPSVESLIVGRFKSPPVGISQSGDCDANTRGLVWANGNTQNHWQKNHKVELAERCWLPAQSSGTLLGSQAAHHQLVTGKQRWHKQEDPHKCSSVPRPNITSASRAYPSHWQLRGVKCRRWLCDIADAESVPSTRTHITGAVHIWRVGGQPDLHPRLGGSSREGRVGPFSLKLIRPTQPSGTYRWGQDRKAWERTVAGVAGDLLNTWGGEGGEGGLFVLTSLWKGAVFMAMLALRVPHFVWW